jgi:hypothetical protein
MAYIGNTVENQGFTPAIDYFNGDGVTVTFTLSRPIASVAQVIVAIDNVIQNPSSSFTVAGNAITFSSAPLSGTNNIWVEYTSLITTYQGISQDPTVIGDIRATGGYLAEGDFGNSFVSGAILDYVTGLGRVTVGPAEGIALYNGGTASRTALMTVAATGNVGIGTSSPSYKLQVSATAASVGITSTTAGQTPFLILNNTADSSNSYIFCPNKQLGIVQSDTSASSIVYFSTQNTERMRIDSNGDLLVGTTTNYGSAKTHINSAGTVLSIYCSGGSGSPGIIIGKASNDASTSQVLMQFLYNSGSLGLGQINGNGSGSAAFGSYSDIRLKENITNIPTQLEKICALRPVEFDYKDGSGHQTGFIAQEIQEVYPEAVAVGQNEMLTVTGWNKTEAYLVKAIQEQQAIIQDLKARIETLEAK